ncbi:hypothetical protein Taro_037991, partial [Colocasia esculenta]|nr:hypothetical protein [Colocasia esculenta]
MTSTVVEGFWNSMEGHGYHSSKPSTPHCCSLLMTWGSECVMLMASCGRRGGVPTCDGEQRRDEPRHEDQAEQQAPAPQGPVLPPPAPVDYGVFMQGLVQAMQTQAHTQATLQAQMEAQ